MSPKVSTVFSIVTAGKALTGKEFDQAIHAYETMHRECKIDSALPWDLFLPNNFTVFTRQV